MGRGVNVKMAGLVIPAKFYPRCYCFCAELQIYTAIKVKSESDKIVGKGRRNTGYNDRNSGFIGRGWITRLGNPYLNTMSLAGLLGNQYRTPFSIIVGASDWLGMNYFCKICHTLIYLGTVLDTLM